MTGLFTPRSQPALEIYNALVAQQALRSTYKGIGWVEAERLVVWEKSKEVAFRMAITPLSLKAVEQAEMQAMGHTDYTAKFARGVAEALLAPRPLLLVPHHVPNPDKI